jgi:sugar lactone lactonase YvrE
MLNTPVGVAADAAGNLYIIDNGNHRVRKVDPRGTITTVAGTGRAGSTGDGGLAIEAQLNGPIGLTVDRDGNLIIPEAGGVCKVDLPAAEPVPREPPTAARPRTLASTVPSARPRMWPETCF